MIIGTCGFCSTGSSAVSDYLKEYNRFSTLDGIEFTYAYLPDGLLDLEHHLTKCISRDDSCSIAIPRFRRLMYRNIRYVTRNTKVSEDELHRIVEEYISSLVQMSWKNRNRCDSALFQGFIYKFFGVSIMSQHVIPYLNKKYHKCFELYPYRNLEVSIYPKDFEAKTRIFIMRLLDAMGADTSNDIVLDQPFPGNDPSACFHLFGQCKAVVVDRDPRDNYIFAKEFLYKRGKYLPTNNVEEFVDYYKLIRQRNPNSQEDKILRIHFEELVYDYEKGTKKIREFLGLTDNPHPQTIFVPNRSMANTQLILKFPQYQKDIEYIEKSLSEYLFDFSNYPAPDHTGEMFMGKSKLNK